jgi:steroid delta-isomerase-like uncharacterized protein
VTAPNEALVRRYYDELWNGWRLDLAGELLAADVTFRGSLGPELRGLHAFTGYARRVQAAFPDFHNSVEALLSAGDQVVARLTYRGTHQGPIFGVAPTGRRVTYPGIAWFHVTGGRIAAAWIVGDTGRLLRELGALSDTPV